MSKTYSPAAGLTYKVKNTGTKEMHTNSERWHCWGQDTLMVYIVHYSVPKTEKSVWSIKALNGYLFSEGINSGIEEREFSKHRTLTDMGECVGWLRSIFLLTSDFPGITHLQLLQTIWILSYHCMKTEASQYLVFYCWPYNLYLLIIGIYTI